MEMATILAPSHTYTNQFPSCIRTSIFHSLAALPISAFQEGKRGNDSLEVETQVEILARECSLGPGHRRYIPKYSARAFREDLDALPEYEAGPRRYPRCREKISQEPLRFWLSPPRNFGSR